jgi:hypothetical protein
MLLPLLLVRRVGDKWHVLPPLPPSSAVLLFGLCTAWLSNNRISTTWLNLCCCIHKCHIPHGCPFVVCRVGDSWHVLPPLPLTSAVLLFGLCTAWRSNDRIRAAEHRVADAAASGAKGTSPRRLSAVLFMGGC